MRFPSKIYRRLLSAILALFFFNAVLDRLLRYYVGFRVFTRLFYLLIGIAILYDVVLMLRTRRLKRLQVASAAWLGFVVALGAVYGDLTASLVAVKQFFFGVVLLFVFSAESLPIGLLVANLAGVLTYAAFQGFYFLTQGFRLPPWDGLYVRELLESGAALNLYQGELIRPFATFGSFTEYQVAVHAFVIVLFLLRERLALLPRRATVALLGMLVLQDVILTDRTPILMSLIILWVCLVGSALMNGWFRGSRRLLGAPIMAGAAVAALLALSSVLVNSTNAGVRRLGESAQFWRAETVQERQAHEWTGALQSIAWFPEGMGPKEVTIQYNPAAQRPHNGFFLLQIGYSYVAPLLFIGFIAAAFRSVYAAALARSVELARVGFCGVGITCAYLAASFFNVPFNGYGGPAFFLTMLWLYHEVGLSNGA